MAEKPQNPPPRKHGLPYYKRYPRDFLEGTVGMSGEVKGAYAILLDLIYIHAGKLTDDPHYIAGALGYSVRKWNIIRKKLIEAGKIECQNGIISTLRSDKEQIIISKYQSNQQLNARARWDNKDLADAVAMPARGIESDTDTKGSLRSPNVREKVQSTFPKKAFEKWWTDWPNKVGRKKAEAAFKTIHKAGNVKFDILMEGAARYVRDKPPDRQWLNPTTWLNQARWDDQPPPALVIGNGAKSWATVMKEIGDESDEEGNHGEDRHPLLNAPKPIDR